MAHVLVLPLPAQGHMNPMVQFSKRLASKGVTTTLVVTRFIARTSAVDARPAAVEVVSDGHDDGGLASAANLGEYLEKLAVAMSESLAALIEARASSPSTSPAQRFTCIVYDSYGEWVPSFARRMGLLAVPFCTQSCAVSAVYYYFSQGKLAVPPPSAADGGDGGGGGARSKALEGLLEMERSEFPSSVFDGEPYPIVVEGALKQFDHVGKNDWVLFNSFEELESEVLAGLSKYMKARAIGPCMPLSAAGTGRITYGANILKPEDACIKWLDTKAANSVAYVSFGSLASLGAAQMEELAHGLLAAGKPFLWVVRATEERDLPRHLLDAPAALGSAMVVRWCPQLEVLAHPAVCCFVTHCGWNSTLEALSFGVPMVALGLWTDQPTNALYVEVAWGAGARGRRDAGVFTRGEVDRCVRAAMDEGEGAAAKREAARKWREKARAAVAPCGSSDRNLDEFVEFVRADAVDKSMALDLKGSEVVGFEKM
ncbi:unnamed protein product [Urochloa decumbens]|uniref:Glycosyltransferase n=1 Tax=Urochloa decumbens TaxID=240449 RepID=A0ABC8YL45_9POAL